MGYKYPCDFELVRQQLWRASSELHSRYNDGFTQWELKKKLYEIYWQLQDTLNKSAQFAGESKWLQEQQAKKVIEIIKS